MVILDTKKYSNHPDDWYLSVQIVFNKEDKITPYVTYLRNTSGGRDFQFEGHYFDKFLDACQDFDKRGVTND